jgi:Membrane proteins related to metalloendopeptidases
MITGVIVLIAATRADAKSANVYMVSIENEELGFVQNKESVTKASENARLLLKQQLGAEVQVEKMAVATSVKPNSQKLLSESQLADKIRKMLLNNDTYYKIEAYQITVDDKIQMIVNNKATAETVLEEVKNSYIPADSKPNVQDATFVENVTVSSIFVSDKEFTTFEDAVNTLKSPVEEKTTYSVVQGDTLSGIAAKNGISTKWLLTINPGLQANSILKIGQVLVLSVPKPLVSVRTTEKNVYTQSIKKAVEYQYDDNKYEDYSSTVQDGNDGVKEITAAIVRINGIEQQSDVVSEKVLTEPVKQVVVKGTKKKGIIMPLSGSITSPFGYRKNPMGSGSEFHKGLDLSASMGTPVRAALDATVKTVAYDANGYGKYVVLSSRDGITTLYGHCSNIAVSEGQKVKQGDVIAYSGSTGRSTGPHLHFELDVQGQCKDPRQYL